MQSIVALEVGMHKRPSLLVERGVVGFHTAVETQQEVVEVQTETDAVGGGDFLVERVEFEHASWLVLVAAYCPDVAGVDECLNHQNLNLARIRPLPYHFANTRHIYKTF